MRSIAIMLATMFMASTLITPLYTLYQQAFGFSTLTLTLIHSTYVVGNLVALLFLGRLSDVLGRRRVVLGAIAIAGASSALYLFAVGTGWLYWARILNGIAIALSWGAGTAWMTELLGHADRPRAALTASTANFMGLAVGAFLAGCLAQYAPSPLELTFVAHLAMLAVVAAVIARTPETVESHRGQMKALLTVPRIGIPRAIRAAFIAPAITGFATFSLIGFYTSLVPSFLNERLHVHNLALAGGIVSFLFVISSAAMILTRHLASDRAMRGGLVLLIPGLVLLVVAYSLASLPLLIAATALVGVAAALGYRGSLQVINQIVPAERRAEVTSSYLIACFVGNSVPVIGIGWLASAAGALVAVSIFAVVVGLFALLTLALAITRSPR